MVKTLKVKKKGRKDRYGLMCPIYEYNKEYMPIPRDASSAYGRPLEI